MVLLAASIPTLRPLMKGVGPSNSRGDYGERGGSYALRNLKQNTIGSYPRRGDDDHFVVLSGGPQAWASEERLHVSVGRGSTKDDDELDGINKTTTVTVSAQQN